MNFKNSTEYLKNEFFEEDLLHKNVSYEPASKYGYTAQEAPFSEIQSIFYDGPEYKGKKTKVFAYLGFPKNCEGKKVPAIVLAHGGGGTAYGCWVKQWVDMGYAAIAVDFEGHIPDRYSADEICAKKLVHEFAGPVNDAYHIISPKNEVFMYHAVTSVIYAHNILRSLSFVDKEKIGITGVSWGGVITCTAIGVDNRFAFAIPVFGCGYLFDARVPMANNMPLNKKQWDASSFFTNSTVPTFFVNGDRDGCFDMSITTKSANALKGDVLVALKPGFNHSHYVAWALCPEIAAYADFITKGTTPLITFGELDFDGNSAKVEVTVPKDRLIQKIALYSNNSNDFKYYDPEDPAFEEILPSNINGNVYEFNVPNNAIRFYVTALDESGNTTSSKVYEID